MSKRITTAVAILGVAGVFSGCDLEQPSAGCQVQDATDAPWQAAYFLKNPADAARSCGKLKGEAIGVFKYLNPENGLSRLAIRPEGAASLVSFEVEDAEGNVEEKERTDPKSATSLSESLTNKPDATGLCDAAGFAPATVNARAVTVIADGVEEDIPAQSVSYAYDSVQVYSAPSAPGTQLKGTFRYSDGAGGEACEYTMIALWPQVTCDINAFNNPTDQNTAARCAEGSGLNPDFDAVCVAAIGSGGKGGCVPNPAKGVPSFK